MQCNASDCVDKVCCKDSRTDLCEVISSSPNGIVETPIHKNSSGDSENKSANNVALKSIDIKRVEEAIPDQEIPKEKMAAMENGNSIKEILVAKCDKLEVKSAEGSISSAEKSEICAEAKVLDEINESNDCS